MNFKETIAEWVAVKKQIQAIRADVKTLNTQEKELRQQITQHMKDQKLDGCTIPDLKAKVTVNTRTKKPSFSRALVRAGLLKYFEGNEDRVDYIMNIIDECAETTEVSSVSLKNLGR